MLEGISHGMERMERSLQLFNSGLVSLFTYLQTLHIELMYISRSSCHRLLSRVHDSDPLLLGQAGFVASYARVYCAVTNGQ